MSVERRQALVPLAADAFHPRDRVGERARRQAVPRLAARASRVHQSGFAQRRQVLGDGLPCDGEVPRELRRRGGAACGQGLDEEAAVRVGQRCEN
jgi:hypothetical protein